MDTEIVRADGPDMLRAALWYARQGVYVFPVHEPLFDHPLGYRCTCEEYRHSEKCKVNHRYLYLEADSHCVQPGKCPRVRWAEKSTTDPATIRRWWGWWPTANIAIDCGKSGIIVLDLDKYKDEYAGENLLSRADEETVTTLTGGGGEHLWYRMPDGKPWGNHNKGLPHGVDPRGAGGYVLAAPSKHKSGLRYAFETGYELGNIDILPVPDKLAELLDRAAQSSPGRASCGVTAHFTETTTARPDLAAWNLSQTTIEKIHNPAERGKRSEADYSVCLALCYAGLNDTEILSVFQHYPIGTNGKYSERGPDYLARTVGNARAYTEKHPQTGGRRDGDPDSGDTDTDTTETAGDNDDDPDILKSGGTTTPPTIPAQINRLRLYLRTGDFADLVPEYHPTETDKDGNPLRLQSVTGYRTGDVDRVIADTALGYLWELGRVEARISNLELSGRTGYSHQTCGRAMRRLCRLFEPVDTGDTGKAAQTYRIAQNALQNPALLGHTDTHCVCGVSVCPSSASLPLATHRTADVFVRSLSALTEAQVAERDERRRLAELPPMKRTRMLAKRLAATADALGPAVLRLVDVLYQYGALPGRSISPLLFKSDTQTRRVVTKAIRAGLVEQTETGVFGLVDDWRERSHELSRTCPLAGVVHKRRLQAADNRLRYCEQALAQCQPARHNELQIRKRRAEAEKWRLSQMEADAYNERAAAAGLAPITSAAVIRPGRGETFAQWQKRRLMDTQSADAAIRAFAPTLRGLDRATAEQMAYYAGYSNYEFARAWALRAIA